MRAIQSWNTRKTELQARECICAKCRSPLYGEFDSLSNQSEEGKEGLCARTNQSLIATKDDIIEGYFCVHISLENSIWARNKYACSIWMMRVVRRQSSLAWFTESATVPCFRVSLVFLSAVETNFTFCKAAILPLLAVFALGPCWATYSSNVRLAYSPTTNCLHWTTTFSILA